VARCLPGAAIGQAAGTVATVASHRSQAMGRRRDMVGRHLRRAYGPSVGPADIPLKVDAAFAWYGRYWAESLRLPGTSPARIDSGMSWQGIGRIARAVGEGRGAILALPHLGGWEWGGFWMVQQGYPVTVVVEALEPPELFEWFAGFRRSLGMEVVAVGPSAASSVLRALRAGGVVCLLCDRNVGGSAAVDVEFFGERTDLPAGPATLALRTGAALLPSAVYFDRSGEGHLAVVRPELSTARTGPFRAEVARLTQALAGELEVLIRRAPTQWHLMQPNWPSDPGYRSRGQ
jgi:lauroyl/myristoyl acyltransferase